MADASTANEAPSEAPLALRAPRSRVEWDRYFDLRWRVLRAPWKQPPGSERDNLETNAIHAALWDCDGQPVAVGRVQLNSRTEAQIRYMAVAPGFSGKGLGSRILAQLEAEARNAGAATVILNSRAEARGFYECRGYVVCGEAETLFGQIRHVRMQKSLA